MEYRTHKRVSIDHHPLHSQFVCLKVARCVAEVWRGGGWQGSGGALGRGDGGVQVAAAGQLFRSGGTNW